MALAITVMNWTLAARGRDAERVSSVMACFSVGPTVFGLMNDFVYGPNRIDLSMATVIGCAVPIMVLMMLLAMKPYRGFHAAMQG